MIYRVAILVLAFLLFMLGYAPAQETENEKAATSAAERWLCMVDNEQYAESWKASAEYFRNAVNQKQWEHSMQTVRKPLGKLISRSAKNAVYKTTLPGAPDGQYVIIQFDTSFENKKSAVETVTPMMDKDGIWRVSGYYIK
jgi:hypothetical protein